MAAAVTQPPPLPGARTSCALLTVLTVLLAWPAPPPHLAAIVRPCYFGLLFWFFWRTGRGSDELQGQPMRLVRSGFFVLWVQQAVLAALHFLRPAADHPGLDYLRQVCEHGALSLLATTLIAYGLMLWIPQVLASHRLLGQHYAQQRGELRLAESARSQLEQRLVDADRRGILGELAASIAHDLRNPLTIVKGTAEALCRRARSADEVLEHTEVIRRNIDKADRTIASLIDLGRPRAAAPTELDAGSVLHEVADLLRVQARRQGLQLVVRLPDHAPVLLHADRPLLLQALLNLLLNAVQASPPGSRILLRARRTPTGRTALAIEDRGSGLPPTVQSRLFTPFFTTKPTGTGLGLLSCRRIATELGGAIAIRPRLRGGTRALLLVPTARASAPAEAT
jgi:signal transduction histidine kinase